MTAIIYIILLVVVIGLFLTILHFFKFFASLTSLVITTNETARETPWEYILTGGFLSMWRVLRHDGNMHARNVLFRNAKLFFGSFALTVGAALLFIDMNTKHCVLAMTQTSSDGNVTEICDARD